MNRTLLLLPLAALVLTVPALIGVYVWRDAQRRRMNAALWTLAAVLAPSFIGFILYLLMRSEHPDLECPQCGAPADARSSVCPQCGARLRRACPRCGAPAEADWKLCPQCGAPLTGTPDTATPPVPRRDRSLRKLLLVVVLAPVLLIALICTLYASSPGGGSSTMRAVRLDEYDAEQPSEAVREAVHAWLESLDARSDRAYALRYDAPGGLGEHYFLIYIPAGVADSPRCSFGARSGPLGSTLRLDMAQTGDSSALICMECSAASPPALQVRLDGKRLRCDVRAVDYNPTLFDLAAQEPAPAPGARSE